jgi:HSP20 family protein
MQNQLRNIDNGSGQVAKHHARRPMFGSLWNMFETPLGLYNDWQSTEPRIEVSENKNEVVVTAEIPGVDEKDIDLEISANGYMTISGEKKHESRTTANGGYFSEIFYGQVSRTVPLPWDLDFAKAEAVYDNGVLTVSLPKLNSEQNNRKRIDVAKGSKRKRRRQNRM